MQQQQELVVLMVVASKSTVTGPVGYFSLYIWTIQEYGAVLTSLEIKQDYQTR